MDVLSIDFDIIMAPTIEFYNNMVGKGWKKLQFNNPGLITAKASFCNYNLILHLLEKIINYNTQIYVAYNHKTIVDFLKDDINITVYNIDHHHDLGYGGDKENALENLSCGNWAKYLFDNNQMNKYIWLKNESSNMFSTEYIKPEEYDCEVKTFIEFIQTNFFDMNFDKIFLCLSPEWVPPYYRTLFFGLLDLINQKLNCCLHMHEGG